MKSPPKYPSTPHWPWSQKVHRDDSYHKYASHFINRRIIITEKLDGGNTCLYRGQVYARSVDSPSTAGWMAMVKKHHVWKTNLPDFVNKEIAYYGEDIYGIHSIEYEEVPEEETFYLFACRDGDTFLSWDSVCSMAVRLGVKTVPNVFRGVMKSEEQLTEFLNLQLKEPSALGGPKEGFVIRIEEEFPASTFGLNVCKFVRANHVQTDEHWTRHWKPCKIKERK